MRALGTLLIVCVALAVVKAAIAALLLALVLALIWAACTHPGQTLGLLTYCAVLGMLNAQPALMLSIILLLIIVSRMNNGK